MTNFEKWRSGLTPESFLGCETVDGEKIDTILKCHGCPATVYCDYLSNKAPGRLIHCWDNFKAWCENEAGKHNGDRK